MLKNIKEFFFKRPFNIFFIVCGFLATLLMLSYLIDNNDAPKKVSHSVFVEYLEGDLIKSIRVENDTVFGILKDNTKFEAIVRLTDEIWNKIHQDKITVSINEKDNGGDFFYIVFFGFFVLLVFYLIYYFQKNKDGSGNRGVSSIFSFGKSRFKKSNPGDIPTRFSDVAGAKKAKEALGDIIEFLKNPEKFKLMGAHIPKGILLAGEPGNGKTLLARAVAGEANCSFLSISGSDFIEVFVGVGASRIRDLFYQARKSGPCILFIDEIDAIGRSRGSGFGGGHDEREQTLNQLLTEMDGFDQYEQTIVVLAATNMPEVLDKALLRPGRFDRVLYVPYPDFDARFELLQIHTKKVPLDPQLDLKEVAEGIQGLSGADIENLVNIAALKISQSDRSFITKLDFEQAYKDIITSKKDMQSSASDKAKEFLPQQVKTKFFDVAGLEDAKEDLKEIVRFLKEPEIFKAAGARIPKGMLMTGDPGNGKTFLARALAGESGVPFFYASGSQFVQKYVGEGAARIRELFVQARKHAPSIIFIDEIDSIGKRDLSGEGGSQEWNNTINQLLTEMDGFVQDEVPVVIVGATNIAKAVDTALKRPGRFDRIITIPYPNLEDRIKILSIHAKNKKFEEMVDLSVVAKSCPGFSAAKLEYVLNEAAILSVSKGRSAISMADIEEAKDRTLMGKLNVGLKRSREDLVRTAYHEAGHALVTILNKDYPFLFHKVTILSRGGALGVSMSLPQDDMTSFSKEQLEAKITVCLAGRIAESLQFNRICIGAMNDFEQATSVAYDMVVAFGMGEATGVVSYVAHKKIAESTQREIDIEIKRILDAAYQQCYHIISSNKTKLKAIAEALLERETLDAKEVYEILELPYDFTKKIIDNNETV
jgi:cell division protease FtsH